MGFEDGDLAKFSRSIVERAMLPMMAGRGKEGWHITTPDGPTSGVLNLPDIPTTSSFGVGRPPSHPAFWNALFEIMRATPTVCFWPGVGPHPRACVADKSVIAELPPSMIESLGEPTVVSSGAEIVRCINLSG
jgi:hypothetical protein